MEIEIWANDAATAATVEILIDGDFVETYQVYDDGHGWVSDEDLPEDVWIALEGDWARRNSKALTEGIHDVSLDSSTRLGTRREAKKNTG